MRISLDFPPMWDRISKAFGVTEKDVIWFTYGNTIYAPCKKMPPDYIIVHEECHSEQQGHSDEGARMWWESYLADAEFRAAQEAEAYGMQYRWMRRQKQWKDRNATAKVLHGIAANLSGPVYGNCLSYVGAKKMVLAYADGTALDGMEKLMPEGEPNE